MRHTWGRQEGRGWIAGTGPAVRSTRQRAAVAALLDELDDFRSAQEVHDLLRHRGERVGLTTVYRALQVLAESGEVDVLRTADGEAAYRRCSSGHHHHLVCRDCGERSRSTGRRSSAGPSGWPTSTASSTSSHTVEIFGTCADCAAS